MPKPLSVKQIHILDTTEKLIAEKGYEKTSIREICASAGVNVAMISYYFGSKEKMMSYLYRYRVQKTKEHFSQFAETIKEGRPEMQLKEMIKYVLGQLFKYQYFHGFVTQEFRHSDALKEDLDQFYSIFTQKLEHIIKKGISTGVFTNAVKPEDILTLIIGSSLFVIRNRNYYGQYVSGESKDYLQNAEKKLLSHLWVTIFSLLGIQIGN